MTLFKKSKIYTMRNFFCFVLFSVFSLVNAQEFKSDITINAEQTGQPNLSIFKTLEIALEEFINKKKWTDTEYLPQERIDCNFFINITTYDNNFFEATIQVQASRPVYKSGYSSSIANFNDSDFSFEYLEYSPLIYSENSDQGNLVSVISYYLYTVLALEADTFKMMGGTDYYQQAKQIVNTAQTGGGQGWSAASGNQSRFRYNDDMLSGIFKEYREALYTYHMKGLDVMESDTKSAKKAIIESLESLQKMNRKRPNSYVMRTFFDAKYNEITRLLSGGPKMNIADTLELLKNISPTYSQDWLTITY